MMKTNFENLKQDLNKKKFIDLATAIVKYQKFKGKIAVQKMTGIAMSEATKANYFNLGCTYIKTKEKKKCVPTTLYKCLDEVVNKCIQPLTPSLEEQKSIYKRNYTKKDATPPVAKLEIINKPIATSNIEYGVKFDNNIMLMVNRDYALGFINGLKFCGKKNAKVITVEIGNINE